jgi:cyclophilin family peptidyl-prolyl cis-trans isomerase
MVTVNKPRYNARHINTKQAMVYAILVGLTVTWFVVAMDSFMSPTTDADSHQSSRQVVPELWATEQPIGDNQQRYSYVCPYMTLEQLTPEERFPHKDQRHMVEPPKGGSVHLICCETTKGPWNILVHEKWAPWGASRFLELVKSGYFDKVDSNDPLKQRKVPLMRCLRGFLCQFGLGGNFGSVHHTHKDTLPDDPNWLPEGPQFREVDGVKRFAQGYLAYAGAGKNSRDLQFIIAIQSNKYLGGGSPWEVPWGELVGPASFETLSKIHTGYGEDGPSQHLLNQESYMDKVEKNFPLIDFILSCAVVDQAHDPEVQSLT